jgi:hypothetical protein
MPVRRRLPSMAHEIAKLILEHAETVIERSNAIETALEMGMALDEIERYFDWLDMIRGPLNGGKPSKESGEKGPPDS